MWTAVALTALSGCAPTPEDLNVLTQHNNNARTGAYRYETELTPSSVGAATSTFGELYRLNAFDDAATDRRVTAQPLFVKGVAIEGRGPRDVLYVATQQNQIFAFDVTRNAPSSGNRWAWNPITLKSTHSGQTRTAAPLLKSENCGQLRGPVGILSTPVIDLAANTMYVVFRTARTFDTTDSEEALNADTHHFIASFDIRTGQELHRHEIRAAGFEPGKQTNRAGLLLMNQVVYVAFGASVCDHAGTEAKTTPPHGWVFAYRAPELAPLGPGGHAKPFNTSPRTGLAGIWQSGAGLAGNGQFVYALTGNLMTEHYTAVDNVEDRRKLQVDPLHQTELGHSIVKLRLQGDNSLEPDRLISGGQPPVVNAFTAGNWFKLDIGLSSSFGGDTDLGSGGPTLLDTGRLIGGGKQGRVYLLDPADMRRAKGTFQFDHTWNGEISPCDYDGDQMLGPNIHGSLVAWRPQASAFNYVYAMPEKDYLKAFRIYDNGVISDRPALSTRDLGIRSPRGMPGGTISLSANGGRDGIVWVSAIQQGEPDGIVTDGRRHGRLLAFDAETLALLWSAPNANEPFAKFVPPTVADGRVFRTTYNGEIVVYGLNAPGPHPARPAQQMGKVRAMTALWRNADHLDIFMPSRLTSAPVAAPFEADVLTTNWEARCPNPPAVERGWRGWFPVVQTDGLMHNDRPDAPDTFYGPLPDDLPNGFHVSAPSAPVAAVPGPANQREQVRLFVADANGRIQQTMWQGAVGWGAWSPLSAANFTAPRGNVTAIWNHPENRKHLDLFVVNADGDVVSTFFDGDQWRNGWFPVSPGSIDAPAGAAVTALWRNLDHLDLFVTNKDGAVMTTHWKFAGGWRAWGAVKPETGRATPGQPIAAVWRDADHLDLFITATDRTVKSIYWQPTPEQPDGWAGKSWFAIKPGSAHARPGQPVTAIYRNPTHLDLFITADDRTVKSIFWEPSREHPDGWDNKAWFSIGARSIDVEPGQAVTAIWDLNRSHLDLFVSDAGGRPMSTFFDRDAWRPEGWFSLQ